MRNAGKVIAILLPLIAMVAAGVAFFQPSLVISPKARHQASAPLTGASSVGVSLSGGSGHCRARIPKPPLIGVAPGGRWEKGLRKFEKTTQTHPSLVSKYVPFGSPFDTKLACKIARQGGLLLIQMNPRHAKLARIAAGGYDTYLTKYAHAIRDSGLHVVFSFAHEMNGHWYPWGYKHTPPSVYVAAWRHMHDVFQRAGATRVIWCWNPNGIILSKTAEAPSPRPWWPGSAYVNWVGIDAYFNRSTETFGTAIQPSISLIRTFTSEPVLIAETAVAPGAQQTKQINSLFKGVQSSHDVVGFVWFDHNRRKRWHIEGRPAAVAAFRRGARQVKSG